MGVFCRTCVEIHTLLNRPEGWIIGRGPEWGKMVSKSKKTAFEKMRTEEPGRYQEFIQMSKNKLPKGKQSPEQINKRVNSNKARWAITPKRKNSEEFKQAMAVAKSKTYTLINPNGIKITIFGLAKFAKDNDLNEQCLRSVIAGRHKTHKGWSRCL